MQIEIENLKYDESRHAGHTPAHAEEKMVWTALDAVDELFTVISANLVFGDVPDDLKVNVPPGPPKSREALAAALVTYITETAEGLERLNSLGLISGD